MMMMLPRGLEELLVANREKPLVGSVGGAGVMNAAR